VYVKGNSGGVATDMALEFPPKQQNVTITVRNPLN
jgi:hypothetical protein